MAIIKRWKELESNQPQLPNFNDPVEAARAWADAREGEIKALAYVERQSKYIGALENKLAEGITPASFAKELNGVNVQKVQAIRVMNHMQIVPLVCDTFPNGRLIQIASYDIVNTGLD